MVALSMTETVQRTCHKKVRKFTFATASSSQVQHYCYIMLRCDNIASEFTENSSWTPLRVAFSGGRSTSFIQLEVVQVVFKGRTPFRSPRSATLDARIFRNASNSMTVSELSECDLVSWVLQTYGGCANIGMPHLPGRPLLAAGLNVNLLRPRLSYGLYQSAYDG